MSRSRGQSFRPRNVWRFTQAHALRAPAPTFGLVTAMPEEFHAMRMLLDEQAQTRVMGDRADYFVGTLPSLDARLAHTVVLTLTADTGTQATADSCKSLVTSFPSVNVVIMAGIAAGVPAPACPDRHVRLGDVVVATLGIVDYRHVVHRADGDELRQPFPRPSAMLNRADRMLQAGEYAQQRPWEAWLALSGAAGLQDFRRPPDESDVLYDTADPARPISHPARCLSGHREGLPKIHRGRIGSADVSMRSSRERDELALRYELLAFEMEGAGIGSSGFLNGLDWFMVRGISDYGDEHISTRWRKYASLTAAAYVRSLLGAASPAAPRGGFPLADGLIPVARRSRC
jgi:nucleoside phosphorylase